MRDHPFSMNVDAPMWSERTGALGCDAGWGAAGSAAPPRDFQRSASFLTSSLSAVSSPISRSSARNSSMISALSAARSVDVPASSRRAASISYRPRTPLCDASAIPRWLVRRPLQYDALIGGEQLRHVEENDQPLAPPDDAAHEARRETAEQRRRRRDAAGVERAHIEHAVDGRGDPLVVDREHEDASVRWHRGVGQLEPAAQIHDRYDTPLIVDHALDPRRNVRHRRRGRVAEYPLHGEDVGGEELVPEPKGHDLRVRRDGRHASRLTGNPAPPPRTRRPPGRRRGA